ncbi:alanine--tRNA ligase [Patescibacteria group bacterium]|nr:alanine--tRNA ligase [Patescibacteria group bacterium]
MVSSKEIRKKYLEFFKDRGHAVIPSASLVPENDPTTLFTGSGMQPLLPYLLGEKHPLGNKLANSQKCFRAGDIEEVGDNRHTTFFEMLGNWSLGADSNFKEEQLSLLFEFLTKEIGLDHSRLSVTVFAGDKSTGIPKDEESAVIWKKLFGKDAKVFEYGVEKNWWSRAGAPDNMPAGEPGGPDSEVFYDFGTSHDSRFGKECHPNCDCGRFMEITNSVFMEYQKQDDGSFAKLKQRNVDFGGGLERIVAAANNAPNIYDIDIFQKVISGVLSSAGVIHDSSETIPESNYPLGPIGNNITREESVRAMRIIADHMRATVFLMADGVIPSNADRGYVVRRLIRRATRFADKLGLKPGTLSSLALPVQEHYGELYVELKEHGGEIQEEIAKEEARFRETLERGLKEFGALISLGQSSFTGKNEFNLYQSHGFPKDVMKDLAEERGFVFDEVGFDREFKKHQELSRTAVAGRFQGGLADHSLETTKLHTAHHLLLGALRKVLGEHVHQKGSNITAERLRMDFSHPKKLAADELKKVENLVNEKIREDLEMAREEMSREEATQLGAEMEFGKKYGDTVSVYLARSKEGNVFSKEFCGGPHVENTGELGSFRILKEEAVSSGIRRIRASLQ